MPNQRILVTGGAGYIGSHTCVELIEAGYEVVVIDNLSTSKADSLAGVERITGIRPQLIEVDLRDAGATEQAVVKCRPHAVIHFAAFKSVAESVKQPLCYFENNVGGSINLFSAMEKAGVRRLVFSSSCTVYGVPARLPVDEGSPTGRTTNPYGQSKFLVEEILKTLKKERGWSVSLLRYFNPIGAHPSAQIGEDPRDVPNNLMPYLCEVAIGRREFLRVWGKDYPTRDGTGVRDYLHVCDLAAGHIAALRFLEADSLLMIHNLGLGRGYSVLEVIEAFAKCCGRTIPFQLMSRRPGDLAETWADPGLAEKELGWRARRDLEEMCRDAWRWQQKCSLS